MFLQSLLIRLENLIIKFSSTWYCSEALTHWIIAKVGLRNSKFLADVRHLHLTAHFKIGNVLSQDCQVLDESCIEFLALVNHIFKVLLSHKGHINSLEERLTSWINSYCLFKITESGPIAHYNVICALGKRILLRYFFK